MTGGCRLLECVDPQTTGESTTPLTPLVETSECRKVDGTVARGRTVRQIQLKQTDKQIADSGSAYPYSSTSSASRPPPEQAHLSASWHRKHTHTRPQRQNREGNQRAEDLPSKEMFASSGICWLLCGKTRDREAQDPKYSCYGVYAATGFPVGQHSHKLEERSSWFTVEKDVICLQRSSRPKFIKKKKTRATAGSMMVRSLLAS